MDTDEIDEEWVVVLSILPPSTGQAGSRVQCIGEEHLTLVEIKASADTDLMAGDRIDLTDSDRLGSVTRQLAYEDLSEAAQATLRTTVAVIIQRHEDRFVEWYNTVGPISLRRHQLELLPDIGQGLRETICEERSRRPFADFADLENRVRQLRSPHESLVERVLTELREETEYQLFVR